MLRSFVAIGLSIVLAGCVTTTAPPQTTASTAAPASEPKVSRDRALRNYRFAVARVEPVAERFCAEQTKGLNCNFLIRIDPNANAPANAFQSVDSTGRPVLTFTQALIADARNADEIAFVLGHEAAHHIAQHLPQRQQSATVGAILGGLIAAGTGANQQVAEELVRAGAFVGSRTYSKENELEADALGTVITKRAGFDPVRGAAFFGRIPDPGDQFLGSHPANSQRIATVRRVASTL